MVCGGLLFRAFTSSLTIRVWRLDLYSALEETSYAFVASNAQSWVLQDHVLRDIEIYDMDFGFDIALDSISVIISDFDFSSFTKKNIVPPKVKHILGNVFSSKSFQGIDVKFDMTTKQKIFFGCL